MSFTNLILHGSKCSIQTSQIFCFLFRSGRSRKSQRRIRYIVHYNLFYSCETEHPCVLAFNCSIVVTSHTACLSYADLFLGRLVETGRGDRGVCRGGAVGRPLHRRRRSHLQMVRLVHFTLWVILGHFRDTAKTQLSRREVLFFGTVVTGGSWF